MKNKALILLSLSIFAVALVAAEGKKPAAQPAGIPEGATQVDPNSYRYTDAAGKAWIYRLSPFGLLKIEDKPAEATPVKVPEGMKASEDGDSIRFERPSPFGVFRWSRKKSDLSDIEQAAWDQARKEKAAGEKSGKE
jgi:hypothetical protein